MKGSTRETRFVRRNSGHVTESGVELHPAHVEDAPAVEVDSDTDYEDSENVSHRVKYRKEVVTYPREICVGYLTGSDRPSKKVEYEHEISPQQQHSNNLPEPKSQGNLRVVVAIFVGVLGIYVAANYMYTRGNEDDDVKNLPGMHTDILKENIRALIKKYPSQKDDLWYHFIAGIKKVTRDQPSQPTTFLLLHTTDARETLRCLTKEIARVAAQFLNASVPLSVEGGSLKIMHHDNLKASKEAEDNGWLIKKYAPLVKSNRSMIVYDLEKVPASLAQAFHVFCDEVSPLVDKAVYMFTLSVPKFNLDRPVKVAENILNELWGGDLSDDIRAPLITRITGAAVCVLPEHKLPVSCH